MEWNPGPDLDREVQRRVLPQVSSATVPPFSTEDWTAIALAELVSKASGWRLQTSERDGTWCAMWTEGPKQTETLTAANRRITALVTSSGPTRAAAICRALLKATRSPRWPRRLAFPEGGSIGASSTVATAAARAQGASSSRPRGA